MRVSIKDIAKAAGVSHSTVSRALSNSPLVADTTRGRIQQIAQELGYAPNAIARGLVTQQTRTIGVIVTTIADPFAGEIVRGIEEIAGNNRYRVILGTSHSDPLREVNLVKGLREWRVDGVIVAASRVGALYLPLLKEIGVPLVLINSQQEGPFIHSVAVDNFQSAVRATQHLIQLKHRIIGYLGGPPDHASHSERLTGYQRALADADISFDPSLVTMGSGRADSGEQVTRFFTRSPMPTAVFCYNDMTAIGALHALKCRGLRVPDDISLVGFDDIELASYVDPPLTTIHQPKDEMGHLAMWMLLDLIGGKIVNNVTVTGKLIVRASTSPPTPSGEA
ncbi:MAG: LacI family DNA-binding transcriptional regulator [Chloroflexi bacterium]|nr:LacI family DNA-binding transcriptional regulator [Chloroflexota bacterium]